MTPVSAGLLASLARVLRAHADLSLPPWADVLEAIVEAERPPPTATPAERARTYRQRQKERTVTPSRDARDVGGVGRPAPTVWTRDHFGLESIAQAWAIGASMGFGGRGVTAPIGKLRDHLAEAVRVHAPATCQEGAAHAERRTWIADSAQAWATTRPSKVDVFAWIKWLDAGAPAEVDRFGRVVREAPKPRRPGQPPPGAEPISQEDVDAAPDVWAPQIEKGRYYIFNPRTQEQTA